jgi:hypothetical protein
MTHRLQITNSRKELFYMEHYEGIESVSSTEKYGVRAEDVQRVYDALPPRVRRGRNRLNSLIKGAIVCVSRMGEDVEYLIGKIDVYYRSEEGRGAYPRLANTWLQDEGWEEHEDLWNPDRAREANRRDMLGTTFHGVVNDNSVDREESQRQEFIDSHDDAEVAKAAMSIIDDRSNGYNSVDAVLGATLGRMLLAKKLKEG